MMVTLETSPTSKIWEALAIWAVSVTWEEVRPLNSMVRTWEEEEEWEELIPVKFSQCSWEEEVKEVLEASETSDKEEDQQTILQKLKAVEKILKISEDLLLMILTLRTLEGEDSAPLVETLSRRLKIQDDFLIIFNDILKVSILITICKSIDFYKTKL